MIYDNQTFVSEEAALIFYLTVLDGEKRANLLGIKEIHYANKNKAKEWYENILSKLSDKNGPAAIKLNKLYTFMVHGL